MVRALVLLAVFFGLFVGTVFSAEFRGVMALAGIAGSCVALDWLTKAHSN